MIVTQTRSAVYSEVISLRLAFRPSSLSMAVASPCTQCLGLAKRWLLRLYAISELRMRAAELCRM